MYKFFVPKQQFCEELNQVVIKGNDVNHIKNVLRARLGDTILVNIQEENQSYLVRYSINNK